MIEQLAEIIVLVNAAGGMVCLPANLCVVYYTQRIAQVRDGEKELTKREMIPAVLVSALPLMGLLGTIAGLQVSFTGMMSLGVDSQVVTGGIADALFTTQLGLTLAIPGWLLLMFVNGAVKRAVAREA